jgi:hypothetical protein
VLAVEVGHLVLGLLVLHAQLLYQPAHVLDLLLQTLVVLLDHHHLLLLPEAALQQLPLPLLLLLELELELPVGLHLLLLRLHRLLQVDPHEAFF